jgi:sugar lactone lactonase YvrE
MCPTTGRVCVRACGFAISGTALAVSPGVDSSNGRIGFLAADNRAKRAGALAASKEAGPRVRSSVLTTAFLGVATLLAGCFSEVTNEPVPGDCGLQCPDAGVPPPDGPDAGPPPVAPPFTEGASTLAGASDPGRDDGDRNTARFDNPVTITRGGDGNLYVADFNNDLVRQVDSEGNVTTIVEQADFQRPFAIVAASPTLLYVQTDDNDGREHSLETGTIWKVDLALGTTTVVIRNVGRPRGLAMLPDGRLLLSDSEHHVLRVLEPRTGALTILAGALDVPGYVDATGMGARFNKPYGVAVRPDGKVLVADYGNHLIRIVDMTGEVRTYAGNVVPGWKDGPREMSQFRAPQDVAIDGAGNLYVSDADNFVIRRITVAGETSTVAGTGVGGYLDHDDPLQAQFYGLEGIDVSADGTTLFVGDGNRGEPVPYNRVRVVTIAAPPAVEPAAP